MEFVPEVKRLLGLGRPDAQPSGPMGGPMPYEVKPESLPTLSVSDSFTDEQLDGFIRDLERLEIKARKAGTSLVAILTEGAKHMGIDLR